MLLCAAVIDGVAVNVKTDVFMINAACWRGSSTCLCTAFMGGPVAVIAIVVQNQQLRQFFVAVAIAIVVTISAVACSCCCWWWYHQKRDFAQLSATFAVVVVHRCRSYPFSCHHPSFYI